MKVRNNSFETNSSSSHSLCLGSADFTNITVLGDTLDIFVSNEAGGELSKSYLAGLSKDDRIREKISYVVSVIFRSIDYDWPISDFDNANNLFMTLKKLIKEHVGVDLRVFVQPSPHQEGDSLMEFSSIGYLKAFIFRPDSYVKDSYNG